MPHALKAVAHVRSMNGGGSKAQLVQASDGHPYIAKLIGNPQGTRILANEYMTGKIAEMLDAPCGHVTIIEIDQSMIDAINKSTSSQFTPGRQHCMSYLGSDTIQVFPSNLDLMTKASNLGKWPNAIVLDTLVQNEDMGDRHILMTVIQGSLITNFWHIDHGHTLGVTRGWASLNSQNIIPRYLYPSLVAGSEPFKESFELLGNISKETIEAALHDCPLDAWGVSDSEKNSLTTYILSAKAKVPEAIRAAKANFTNWK